MEQEQNANAPTPEAAPLRVSLDDVTIAMVTGLQEQVRGVMIAQQTLVEHFKRRHSLQGDWIIAENGRELIQKGA